MSTVKIITGFARMRDGKLAVRAQTIVDSMTGNEYFPAPTPPLVDVHAALLAYKDALTSALDGGKISTIVKRDKRKELEALLHSLALYVQANCQNDLYTLLTSGFTARRPRSPIGILPKPEKFSVVNGVSPGSIRLRIDKIHGARTYFFEYSPTPDTNTTSWQLFSKTTRT